MNGSAKGVAISVVFSLWTPPFLYYHNYELGLQNSFHHIHIFRGWLQVSVNKNSGKFFLFWFYLLIFVLEGSRQHFHTKVILHTQ